MYSQGSFAIWPILEPRILCVFMVLMMAFPVSTAVNYSATSILPPNVALDELPAGGRIQNPADFRQTRSGRLISFLTTTGTVIVMYSGKYCSGEGTAILHDVCHHLGFDEWQVPRLSQMSRRLWRRNSAPLRRFRLGLITVPGCFQNMQGESLYFKCTCRHLLVTPSVH